MTAKLSDDLARAIDAHGDVPVRTVHPVTGKAFLLVSEERFEQLRALFEAVPLSQDEKRHLLQQAGRRAGWEDPAMDAYDRYDEHNNRATP
jgi:hypothetical protein